MTKLKRVTVGQVHWLAAIADGRTHLLYRMGKVGDCINMRGGRSRRTTWEDTV